jgi:hypothetical protein
MFEQRRVTLFVSVLLIAIVAAGALGYGLGRFVTPPEQITTTTTATTTTTSTTAITATTTQVSTFLVTVTERMTTTSTVSRALLPRTFPPPANSSAVIRSFYLFNGSVLAALSIDKPVYSQGETVHIKATLTNLTPDYLTLDFDYYTFDISNNIFHDIVWTYPEYMWGVALAPGPSTQIVIPPGETKTGGQWSGADWNMKGLHLATNGETVYYDDHFVPEGQYTLRWETRLRIRDKGGDGTEEQISFIITKPN